MARSLLMAQEAASKIVNQIGGERNQINRIFPMSFFRTEVTRITNSCNRLTDSDLKIILTHLDRDKSAIVYDDQVSHVPSSIFRPLSHDFSRPSNSTTQVRHRVHCQTETEQYLL